MNEAKNGDMVSVHYTGKRLDGRIYDSTSGEEPLTFILGQNDLIDGLEEAVLGMFIGEQKSVTLAPEKAPGGKSDDTSIEMDRLDMPEELELKVGDELEITSDDQGPFIAVVSKLDEDTVTLNCASPLAGETLVFDLELVDIK